MEAGGLPGSIAGAIERRRPPERTGGAFTGTGNSKVRE